MTVKEHERRILAAQARSPSFQRGAVFDDALDDLCRKVLDDEERMAFIAALMAAATGDFNLHRAAPSFLQKLAGVKGNGNASLSAGGVESFVRSGRTNSPGHVFNHMRLLLLLMDTDHECVKHPIFKALMAREKDLTEMRRAFASGLKGPTASQVRLRSIADAGADFYRLIEASRGTIDRDAILALIKKSSLFQDFELATPHVERIEEFNCVRLAPTQRAKGDHLIVGRMDVTAMRHSLQAGPDNQGPKLGPSENVYLYNELFITAKDRPASTGFMVPRNEATYILNHELGNDGFITMAVPKPEIVNTGGGPFIRGVVMGLNRESHLEPIISRMVLTRRAIAGLPIGLLRVDDFREALEEVDPDLADDIIAYLHHLPEAEVAASHAKTGKLEHSRNLSDIAKRLVDGELTDPRIVTRIPISVSRV